MNKARRTCVCAFARNEYNYIYDWVKYYLRIGFTHITIHDNNDVNGERYDELLKEFIDAGTVDIVDMRGKQWYCMQEDTYSSFYSENVGNYDWILNIDVDEYLWFNENGHYSNINEVLDVFDDKCDALSFYWRCYGDCDKIKYEDGPVYERFTTPLPSDFMLKITVFSVNTYEKTMYRTGFNVRMGNHFLSRGDSDRPMRCLTMEGKECRGLTNVDISHAYDEVYVKHFITKTVEEWLQCKMFRGHCGEIKKHISDMSVDLSAFVNQGRRGWSYSLERFFEYNDITKDKVDYLARYGYNPVFKFQPSTFLFKHFNDNYNSTQADLDKIDGYITSSLDECVRTLSSNHKHGVVEGPQWEFSLNFCANASEDMIWLTTLGWSGREVLGNTVLFVNVGYPIVYNDSELDFYHKQMNDFFSDPIKLQHYAHMVIGTNNAIALKDSLVSNERIYNAYGNDNVEVFKKALGATNNNGVYVRNNIFMCDTSILKEHLYDKKDIPGIISDSEIEGNAAGGWLTAYNLLQCAFYDIFDEIIGV